jgi:hypothetical protein
MVESGASRGCRIRIRAGRCRTRAATITSPGEFGAKSRASFGEILSVVHPTLH